MVIKAQSDRYRVVGNAVGLPRSLYFSRDISVARLTNERQLLLGTAAAVVYEQPGNNFLPCPGHYCLRHQHPIPPPPPLPLPPPPPSPPTHCYLPPPSPSSSPLASAKANDLPCNTDSLYDRFEH
ncbi:hypothetical protein QLX08_003919 [Tetragonisca angustula]|uniref:Uncharacterized protein n=1 Tax=Tetragonisca angustula TaxID=166442 RepID=A0AAW1A4M4_9HYME